MYRSSKRFSGFPCAHRKWRHQGHCAWVHGYSREFIVWFEASQRDENGFVMDYGGLKAVRDWLRDQFDHTLLLDADDPQLEQFRALEQSGACKLNILEDVSMEGTARHVFEHVDQWVKQQTDGRVWVTSVECRENENNSGLYQPDDRR